MKKVFFKTFGCRTNIYDTQVMMENLTDFEITENEQNADIIVVNSCTVTNGADTGVRSYINHATKEGKKSLLQAVARSVKGRAFLTKKKFLALWGTLKNRRSIHS